MKLVFHTKVICPRAKYKRVTETKKIKSQTKKYKNICDIYNFCHIYRKVAGKDEWPVLLKVHISHDANKDTKRQMYVKYTNRGLKTFFLVIVFSECIRLTDNDSFVTKP
jgi:hypothetical protein